MGLGGDGPPKKKLKQAQLNFCVSTEKASNKRKLSDSSDGLAPKLFRKDPGTQESPTTPVCDKGNPGTQIDKENLAANKVYKSNDVLDNAEPNIDVVVLDEDTPECDVTQEKSVKEAIAKEENGEIHSSHGLKNAEDQTRRTEPSNSEPAEETIEYIPVSKDEAKAVQGDKPGSSSTNYLADSAESKTGNCPNVKGEAEGKTDLEKRDDPKSGNDPESVTTEQGDVNTSVVLSSEDEQEVSSPNLKTPPNRKNLVTPRSSTKKAERERQREEKLRLKKEKEEQRRKEKEEKDKKKLEELRLKEEERRRKEEERKRKEEAKEEERKRKEEERKKKEEAKEEERRKKEEEKKKKEEMKEEDRRKKEEARLAEERKENLAKAAFTKFFITEKAKPTLPKKDEIEAQSERTERPKFMPFPVKSDMRLAAQVRHTLTEEERNVLSKALSSDEPMGDTYLDELKKGRKPMTSSATWPLSEEQHDVIIVEFVEDDKVDVEQKETVNTKSKGQRAKLLQFHENRRPPYWGTWRKPSKAVGPRRPFGQDEILDYEVDSDSEWEDEEEGEDIEKEDGDSDKEEADDDNVGENGYVLDNTFVPHGYLSDEEADEGEDDDSVEDQKLKLTVLKQEFDQELKSKTQRLQPRLLGCVYISNMTLEVSKSIYEPLMKLRCKWNDEPIDVTSAAVVECSPSPIVVSTKFPSSMVKKLAKLIHGNRSSMKALISEFMASCEMETQLSSISKRAVFLKVKEIAAKTYSSESGRLVWAVNPDLCAEFGLEPIVDPPKIVPAVSPVGEPVKPKDSPLVSFLKKTPQGPVKRIPTTLVREGPSETASSRGLGADHVDTPRPKFVPQVSMLAVKAQKPIRRVATTLLSSVAGPVENKTFNVGEIDKPGQFTPVHQSKSTGGPSMVDLTDSGDGITPLPDEGESVSDGKSGSSSVLASCDSANPSSAATSEHSPKPEPMDPVKDDVNPVGASSVDVPAAGQGDRPSHAHEPMETDPPLLTGDVEAPAEATKDISPTAMLPFTHVDPEPSSTETDRPPEPPSTNDAKTVTTTPNATKSLPSTPAPVRKRVPLVTLSKSVSKTKNALPRQQVSIADMFCRKPSKKEIPSKPNSNNPPTAIDLSYE